MIFTIIYHLLVLLNVFDTGEVYSNKSIGIYKHKNKRFEIFTFLLKYFVLFQVHESSILTLLIRRNSSTSSHYNHNIHRKVLDTRKDHNQNISFSFIDKIKFEPVFHNDLLANRLDVESNQLDSTSASLDHVQLLLSMALLVHFLF